MKKKKKKGEGFQKRIAQFEEEKIEMYVYIWRLKYVIRSRFLRNDLS